jgi:hypothetical protein
LHQQKGNNSAFTNNKKNCASRLVHGQAHFDCVPPLLRVVDGAKTRWCHLLLIDGLISLIELREINNSSRRSFNQHQILLECIVEELELAGPAFYNSYKAGQAASSELVVAVSGIEHPWNDVLQLRQLLLSDPTTKSKVKFLGITDSLLGHAVVQNAGADFNALFLDAVKKAIFTYPPQSDPSSLSRINMPPVSEEAVLPSVDTSFDVSVFDDFAASELDTQPWEFLESEVRLISMTRPPHPLRGHGTEVIPSTQCLFAPIDPCAPTHAEDVWHAPVAVAGAGPSAEESVLNSLQLPADGIPSLRWDTSAGQNETRELQLLVPFPQFGGSVFARRVSFGPALDLCASQNCSVVTPLSAQRPVDNDAERRFEAPTVPADERAGAQCCRTKPGSAGLSEADVPEQFWDYVEFERDLDGFIAHQDNVSASDLSLFMNGADRKRENEDTSEEGTRAVRART